MLFITAGLLPMLGVKPAAGRLFRPEEDSPGASKVALISHDVAAHLCPAGTPLPSGCHLFLGAFQRGDAAFFSATRRRGRPQRDRGAFLDERRLTGTLKERKSLAVPSTPKVHPASGRPSARCRGSW